MSKLVFKKYFLFYLPFTFFLSTSFFCLFIVGCATHRHAAQPQESTEEQISAIESVMGGMAMPNGEKVEMKELVTQLRHDQEAKSAIQSIAQSMSQQKKIIKYSPVTGKHYSPDLDYEPGTGVKLEVLEE